MTDATSYTIPNRLSAFLAAAFIPAALAAHMAPMVFAASLGLGAAGLAVGIAMFAMRWIGGGDAKLIAACAMWLGWTGVAPFLLWTAMAGGGLALALILLRRSPFPLSSFGPAWFGRLMTPGGDVPYGIAIAAGALFAMPAAPVLAHLHG
jgi:prepilin peptidase CpaA